MATKKTDISTMFGIVAAFGLIISAIFMGGSASGFIDYPSILIVIGGTFSLVVASYSFGEVFSAFRKIGVTIFYNIEDPHQAGLEVLKLSQESRKNGVLSLQQASQGGGCEFMKMGLQMIIDGIDPKIVENVMNQSTHARMNRHAKGADVFRKAGEISPAMGLIGTLIGLVQMLGNLDNPESIGPAMAVALLTTMYGAILAYAVFLPLSAKMERNSSEELMTDRIYTKGISAIGRNENPRQIETALNSILPPERRIRLFG